MNTSTSSHKMNTSQPGLALAIMERAQREYSLALKVAPAWLARFEDADHTCMVELEYLLAHAPTAWYAGQIYGEMIMLESLAQVTGRSAH